MDPNKRKAQNRAAYVPIAFLFWGELNSRVYGSPMVDVGVGIVNELSASEKSAMSAI